MLPKTLDCILLQTFGDFELIISDDCSSDNTEEICRSYAAKDRRIRYFRNEKNLGIPGNLNRAIQLATGLYIATLHDGDVYRPDLLERWKSALDIIPSSPFVFNDYDVIHPDGSRRIYRMCSEQSLPGFQIALHYFRTITSCVSAITMARSSAYASAGPFDPAFGFLADVDMWLRLARDAEQVAYVPEPLITIAPREAHHPYRHVHWRHSFWSLGIYTKHLWFYQEKYPDLVAPYVANYHRRRRRYLLHDMAYLIKHRQWRRVKEGLAIWQDADDPFLARIGHMFGRPHWRPDWYHPSWWDMTRLRLST